MLKSEKIGSALLVAQYGFSRPENVLRALQRDSLWAQQFHLEDVYKKTTAEVGKLNSKSTRYHPCGAENQI